MQTIDYLGPHGGELALAFAAGCVATWVFMKVLYDQRIIDIKASMTAQKEQCDLDRRDSAISEARLWDRIRQLETILMTSGNPRLQAELAKVIDDDQEK